MTREVRFSGSQGPGACGHAGVGERLPGSGSSAKEEPWWGGAARGEQRDRAWGEMGLVPLGGEDTGVEAVGVAGESLEAVQCGMEGTPRAGGSRRGHSLLS